MKTIPKPRPYDWAKGVILSHLATHKTFTLEDADVLLLDAVAHLKSRRQGMTIILSELVKIGAIRRIKNGVYAAPLSKEDEEAKNKPICKPYIELAKQYRSLRDERILRAQEG